MAVRPKLKIRHSYVDTYPLTAQRNWVGAQSLAGRRGWWNDLADTSALCRAMKIDPVNDRYLYFAAGAVLKRRDILLGSTTDIATVSGGSATIDAIYVDSTYVYVGGGRSPRSSAPDATTPPGSTNPRSPLIRLGTRTRTGASIGSPETRAWPGRRSIWAAYLPP